MEEQKEIDVEVLLRLANVVKNTIEIEIENGTIQPELKSCKQFDIIDFS